MMNKRKSTTLQNVAEIAGVSVSTASRVLNSTDFAKKETRESVINAALRTGYVHVRRSDRMNPAFAASGYQHDDSALKNLLLLAPQSLYGSLGSQDWIFRDIIPTIYQAASDNGFRLSLSSYNENDQNSVVKIATENIDGIIWMADNQRNKWVDLLGYFAKLAPIVVINSDSIWPPRTCVMSNNRLVLFKGIEHLVELGHRRIGYFDTDDSEINVHCRERLDAYRQAVAHFQLDDNPGLCVLPKFGVNEHPRAVAKAMDHFQAMPSKPTAIISPLTYAIQFLKVTYERSIHVPNDFSIVAIDDAHAAELLNPPLTVVDCGFSECATLAVELIIEQAESSGQNTKTVLLEPTLIVRGSTAAPGKLV